MPRAQQAHFERAKKHLAAGDADSLRYACLELRLCIEEIIYDKAKFYAHSLSRDDLGTWHPRILMRILEDCDPHAGRSYVLALRPAEPGAKARVVGRHDALPQKVLNDHYTKLGKFVHSTPPDGSTPPSTTEVADFIRIVLQRIERPALNITQSGLVDTVGLGCICCNRFVGRSVHYLKGNPVLVCHHDNCGAIYDWKEGGGEAEFTLRRAAIKCIQCNVEFRFPAHRAANRATLSCSSCGQRYEMQSGFTLLPIASDSTDKGQDPAPDTTGSIEPTSGGESAAS